MTITIYATSSCPACTWTKRTLDRKGIPYQVINLDEHPEHAQRLRERGHATLPVVITPHDEWAGARPDKLNQLTHTTKSWQEAS